MKRAILTVGPQYAGKSTFCEKVAAAHPEVTIISRDKILLGMFGTVMLEEYSGGHSAALEEMWRQVRRLAASNAVDRTFILDTWNGPPTERAEITSRLRDVGFDQIVAWQFVTPVSTCVEWSLIRHPINPTNSRYELWKQLREDEVTGIDELFKKLNLEKEGVFDTVRRINPLDPVPEDLLA